MTATNHRPTTPETPHANDKLLTMTEVSELIRIPVATLRYYRHLGSGPRSFKVGRTVRYWRSGVYQWLEEQSRRPQTRH
jgi:predicted DNA-binding transcriptional regulator AlpA